MQPGQNPLEEARMAYEEHVRACRFCVGTNGSCQSAKLLRRTYNNLLRTAPRGTGAAPRDNHPADGGPSTSP
jgi:hypothetical protein